MARKRMNLQEAMAILKTDIDHKDGGLFCLGRYLAWKPGSATVTLDDEFTIDELEAIVVFVRNHSATPQSQPVSVMGMEHPTGDDWQ